MHMYEPGTYYGYWSKSENDKYCILHLYVEAKK